MCLIRKFILPTTVEIKSKQIKEEMPKGSNYIFSLSDLCSLSHLIMSQLTKNSNTNYIWINWAALKLKTWLFIFSEDNQGLNMLLVISNNDQVLLIQHCQQSVYKLSQS